MFLTAIITLGALNGSTLSTMVAQVCEERRDLGLQQAQVGEKTEPLAVLVLPRCRTFEIPCTDKLCVDVTLLVGEDLFTSEPMPLALSFTFPILKRTSLEI